MESSSTAQSDTSKCAQFLQTTLNTVNEKNDKIINALKSNYTTYRRLERLLFTSHTQFITDINLSITETKKISSHKEKKNLKDSKETKNSEQDLTHGQVLEEYEQEYNVTEAIAVKDIFNKRETDKVPAQRLLILGRAGIGKSTMSQYFAYEWSQEKLWNDRFDYVFWIPLRKLASSDYQTTTDLSLAMILHLECLRPQDQDNVTREDIKKLLKEQNGRCLFLLDGYDEIVALLRENSRIKRVYDQMLEMEYVVLTSRPYSLENTVLFQRQLENMGFTDENISAYVQRYFTSLEESKEESYEEKGSGREAAEKCLTFLKTNPSLWGSAHVPINLALMVESWQQAQQEQQKESLSSFSNEMNLTQLYQTIARYLVKRCLEKRKAGQTENEIWFYSQVEPELAYLERLAFKGLQQTTAINLESETQKVVLTEVKEIYPNANKLFNHVLELGFLKTVTENKKEEIDKAHYFIHLTFQEFFAARYWVSKLNKVDEYQKKIELCKKNKPINEAKKEDFKEDLKKLQQALQEKEAEVVKEIAATKYNPRYQIMLGFIAGLLSSAREKELNEKEKISKEKTNIAAIRLFWNSLLAPPLDISGAGHLGLLIRCFEEARGDDRIPCRDIIIQDIKQWIDAAIRNSTTSLRWLFRLLSVQPHVLERIQIQTSIQDALNSDNKIIRGQAAEALGILSEQGTLPEFTQLIETLCQKARDKKNITQRRIALEQLSRLSEKAVSASIKEFFFEAFNDHESEIKNLATEAAYRFNITTITNQLISFTNLTLTSLNKNSVVIKEEKNILPIQKIESTVRVDEIKQEEVEKFCAELMGRTLNSRDEAQKRLAQQGKITIEKVVSALIQALEGINASLREKAAEALGELDEKAVSEKVVTALLQALKDEEEDVRLTAAEALGRLGERIASEKVVGGLLQALKDEESCVRVNAAEALGRLGEKAASERVVTGLIQALCDEYEMVRAFAAEALGRLGEKAASERVVTGLIQALCDEYEMVRAFAAEALGKLGEKAASEKVVGSLLQALRDEEFKVRTQAAESLRQLAEKVTSEKVVAILLQALGGKEKDVRAQAAWALGNLCKKAASEKVLVQLVHALEDKECVVRKEVALALGKLDEKVINEKVVLAVLQALGDKKYLVRAGAAEALGILSVKVASEAMVVSLIQALGDKEINVREKAVEALRRLIKKTIIFKASHTLGRLLMNKVVDKKSEKAVRLLAVAILGLGQLGEKAAQNEVVEVLHRTLEDTDQAVALEVAIALANLGERTNLTKITKILCQNLWDDEIELDNKRRIITALAQLGEKALVLPSVKEALQISLSDTDPYIREQAAKALGQLTVTHLLSRYLKDKNAVSAKTLAELALKHGASIVITQDKETQEYKLYVEEGQNKSNPSLTSQQVIELREAFAIFNQSIKSSSSYLSYSFSIDNWAESKDEGSYIIKTAFGKQAIKIELIYQHDLCKKASFDVLSTALKTLDHEHLLYLDLSDNRLTDEVAATLAVRYIATDKWSNLRTLKLSNNQLSFKGLCYLLQELSENSSLKFLDVDQNHIACEAKQFQEKLEPLIKKAQLERLDLSMNFVEKGKLNSVSEKISSRGGLKTISYKEVRDKKTLQSELKDENMRLYCKSFFAHSTVVQSNRDMMLSLLNFNRNSNEKTLKISESHGVVALLANKSPHFFEGQHAFLVLEYLHTFGQRSIITGDLFFNDKTKKISIRVAHVTPQELLNRVYDGESVYSNVARVEKKHIKEMIKKMCESRDKQDFGKYAAIFTKNGVYNCLTWAVGILEEAQIVKDISHWRPSDNIAQESRCLVM